MTDLRAVAEKIHFNIKDPIYLADSIAYIESILREVVEEARQDGIKTERASNSGATKTVVGYVVGWEAALEQAVKIVTDYRANGKYETGHGFMTDLDEIAAKIRALKDSK